MSNPENQIAEEWKISGNGLSIFQGNRLLCTCQDRVQALQTVDAHQAAIEKATEPLKQELAAGILLAQKLNALLDSVGSMDKYEALSELKQVMESNDFSKALALLQATPATGSGPLTSEERASINEFYMTQGKPATGSEQRGGQEKWTVYSVKKLLGLARQQDFQAIAEAHNATLQPK